MNEEIKALIERETQEYSERIKKNTNFNSNDQILATAAFNRGANIISEAITNQFRWRKVEDELPEIGFRVIVKFDIGFNEMCYRNLQGKWRYTLTNGEVHCKIVEWMPIPNN